MSLRLDVTADGKPTHDHTAVGTPSLPSALADASKTPPATPSISAQGTPQDSSAYHLRRDGTHPADGSEPRLASAIWADDTHPNARTTHPDIREGMNLLSDLHRMRTSYEKGELIEDGVRTLRDFLTDVLEAEGIRFTWADDKLGPTAAPEVLFLIDLAETALKKRIVDHAASLLPTSALVARNPQGGLSGALVRVGEREIHYQRELGLLSANTPAARFLEDVRRLSADASLVAAAAAIDNALAYVHELEALASDLSGNLADKHARMGETDIAARKFSFSAARQDRDYALQDADRMRSALAGYRARLLDARTRLEEGDVEGAGKAFASVVSSRELQTIPELITAHGAADMLSTSLASVTAVVLAGAIASTVAAAATPPLLETFGASLVDGALVGTRTARAGFQLSKFFTFSSTFYASDKVFNGAFAVEPLYRSDQSALENLGQYGKELLSTMAMFAFIGGAARVAGRMLSSGPLATAGKFLLEVESLQAWQYLEGQIERSAFGNEAIDPVDAFLPSSFAHSATFLLALKAGNALARPVVLPLSEALRRRALNKYGARLAAHQMAVNRVLEQITVWSAANQDATRFAETATTPRKRHQAELVLDDLAISNFEMVDAIEGLLKERAAIVAGLARSGYGSSGDVEASQATLQSFVDEHDAMTGRLWNLMERMRNRGGQHPRAGGARDHYESALREYEAARSSPGRKDLHDRIVADVIQGGTTSERPTLIFTAGAPGAGKSTSITALGEANLIASDRSLLIDPDAMKERIPEYRRLKELNPEQAASAVHPESADLQTRLFEEGLRQNKNMIVDGTLRDADYFEGVIQGIRRTHPQYSILIIHVDANEATMLERVASRARETGRHVPESFVIDVKKMVGSSVDRLKQLADATFRIDNDQEPVLSSFSKDGQDIVVNMRVPWKGDPNVVVQYGVCCAPERLSADSSVGTANQIKGAKRVLQIQTGEHLDVRRLEADVLSQLDPAEHWVVVRGDDPGAADVVASARRLKFETIAFVRADAPNADPALRPAFYAVAGDDQMLDRMWSEVATRDEESRVPHIRLDFSTPAERALAEIAREAAAESKSSRQQFVDGIGAAGAAFVEPRELDAAVFQGRTPVLFSGASRSSWPKISPEHQAQVAASVRNTLRALDPAKVVVVTGGTNYGVEKVVHEEARRRGFTVLGTFAEITSSDAQDIGPVTHAVGTGNSWYGKARPVLKMISERKGFAVFIGGGVILKEEIAMAREMGTDLYLMRGPEGAANDVVDQMPESAFEGEFGLSAELFRKRQPLLSAEGRRVARDAMFFSFASSLDGGPTETVDFEGLKAAARGLKVRVLGGFSGLGYEKPEAVRARLRERITADGDDTLYVIGGTSDGIGQAYDWIPQMARERGFTNVKTAGIVSRNAAEWGIAKQDYIVFVDTPVDSWEVAEGGRSLMVRMAGETGGEMIYYNGGSVSVAEIQEALAHGVRVSVVKDADLAPNPTKVAKRLLKEPGLVVAIPDPLAQMVSEANSKL